MSASERPDDANTAACRRKQRPSLSRLTTSSPASTAAAAIASNLAVACWYCNSFKGSDISGLDPQTRKLTRLFHPRRHKWSHHFRYEGAVLIGRTAIGRTTIRVLQINCDEAVTLRESLIAEGLF